MRKPMGVMAQLISDKLTSAFRPTRLELLDDSGRHAGHAGADARGPCQSAGILSLDRPGHCILTKGPD